MSNVEVQMSNEIQSSNFKFFYSLAFDIHLKFGFWHLDLIASAFW